MHNLKLKTFVGLAVVSASIFIGLGGCPKTTTHNENNGTTTTEVVVDVNLPLTGELGIYGSSMRNSMTMAVEDLKASENNAPVLKFDWQDNAGKQATAVSVFQQQYLEPPDIYVSGFTPQTLAINEQVAGKGSPHFVWAFDAFLAKNYKNNFRTWVSYKIEPPLYFDFVKARNPQKVAILYTNVSYAVEEMNKIVIPKLKEMGVQDIYAESYDLDLKDYKSLAQKVKLFNPDVIILNGFPFTLVSIIKALRPLDLIKDNNTIATYDMINAAANLGADEVEGIRVVTPSFFVRPTPEYEEWSKRFQEKFNRVPDHPEAYSYDMVQVINDAAKRVTQPATPEQWIEAIKATKIEGITGELSFDQDGDLQTPIEIGVFRNGKLIPEKMEEAK